MSQTLLLIIVNVYNWQMIRNVFVLYLIQSWYIFDVQMKCDGPNVALTPLSYIVHYTLNDSTSVWID